MQMHDIQYYIICWQRKTHIFSGRIYRFCKAVFPIDQIYISQAEYPISNSKIIRIRYKIVFSLSRQGQEQHNGIGRQTDTVIYISISRQSGIADRQSGYGYGYGYRGYTNCRHGNAQQSYQFKSVIQLVSQLCMHIGRHIQVILQLQHIYSIHGTILSQELRVLKRLVNTKLCVHLGRVNNYWIILYIHICL